MMSKGLRKNSPKLLKLMLYCLMIPKELSMITLHHLHLLNKITINLPTMAIIGKIQNLIQTSNTSPSSHKVKLIFKILLPIGKIHSNPSILIIRLNLFKTIVLSLGHLHLKWLIKFLEMFSQKM